MSEITHTFKKLKVLVDPTITSHQNVISRIYWKITFTDGVSESAAIGATDVDVQNLDNFIEIQNVTDETIEKWVTAKEGGDTFIQMLSGIHTQIINRKTSEAQFTVYFEDPDEHVNPLSFIR